MLVLGPLIVSLLPDWDLPDLNVNLPDTPDINLPDIYLPVPNWDFSVDFMAPEWVLVALDYSKIWVPSLIGIVIGVIAMRRMRKSDETKRKWQEASEE